MLDRRKLLAGGAATLAVQSPALAEDAQQGKLSAILVDVGPLHRQGLGVFADAVRSALHAALVRGYAERLGGGRIAPRLVVRVDGISLRSYVGSGGGRWSGGGIQNDYLEGEALLIGARNGILARHPQLSALPSSSGDAWYDPGSETRRLVALAAHYAGWLRRSPI